VNQVQSKAFSSGWWRMKRKQYFPVPRQSAQLVLSQLSEHKKQQLVDLIPPGLFKERPGLLNHITLHISKPIRQTVYRIPNPFAKLFTEYLIDSCWKPCRVWGSYSHLPVSAVVQSSWCPRKIGAFVSAWTIGR